MSENPLLDIISAIKDLSESDECDSPDSLQVPVRSWCMRKSDVDSIGYAGTNTNDSGYKSFCPTPDEAEYDGFDTHLSQTNPKESASAEQILKLRHALECALSRYKPKVPEKTNYLKPSRCCCASNCVPCLRQRHGCANYSVEPRRLSKRCHKQNEDPPIALSDNDTITGIAQQLDLILHRIPPETSRSSLASTASTTSSLGLPPLFYSTESVQSSSAPTLPSSVRSKVKCTKPSDSNSESTDYHLYEEIIYELMTSNPKSEELEPPPLPERPKGMKNPKKKKKNFLNFIHRRKQPSSEGCHDDDYGFCAVGKK